MLVNNAAAVDGLDALFGGPGRGPRPALAPWRLSGVVYGVALNDPAALQALGDAVHQPPYKAPPRAPVLYLKPRATLAASGATVAVDADVPGFELGAALALVIGRTACRVPEAEALGHLAGVMLVADLSVPHAGFYRPSVRHKARDGSCLLGPAVAPPALLQDPAACRLALQVDGQDLPQAGPPHWRHPPARLLAEVTEFMTLSPGDLLLAGLTHGAPVLQPGQSFRLHAPGAPALGALHGRLGPRAAVGGTR